MKKRKEKASDRELKSTARGNRGKRARRRDDTPARDEQWWREGGRKRETQGVAMSLGKTRRKREGRRKADGMRC